ncbi:nucleotidyl transferase AbiEii/AbiGii toxin family protein [Amycolatopsis sp. NPDC059027]|uniref:nucleotidyl transferase AbiEii/AbiGii toxin family protein n=1 Tax=unclassified Amycolatopsis TaxID=2618356 RepID=UPI00366E105F
MSTEKPFDRHRTAPALLAALDARLRTRAQGSGLDINRLRRQVAFERLLVRLAADSGATWVLKGGLALELRLADRSRSTKDLDIAFTSRSEHGEDIRAQLLDLLAEDVAEDHFVFAIGLPKQLSDDQAGRPGWRFPVDVKLAGKTFVNVRLDVVARADEIHGGVERLTFPSALAFAGYPQAVTVDAIDVFQHAAEKFHALTRDYGDRPNTRAKDLVDLVLLIEQGLIAPDERIVDRLDTVFSVRGSHTLPLRLPAPPAAWRSDYTRLAADLDVEARTVDEAHSLVTRFWDACTGIGEEDSLS